jgi:hypothetical protein
MFVLFGCHNSMALQIPWRRKSQSSFFSPGIPMGSSEEQAMPLTTAATKTALNIYKYMENMWKRYMF